ncbi:MAG: type IX secretion system membrane protein PorP/SprF [Bacteroidota bacterium]|nr:type IX secretion system membrane protein PorP/SprF [Bacteroidota bacterium]
MKLNKYIIYFLLVFSLTSYAQQQTLFTNILINQYLYNPAYAGTFKGKEFNLGYRQQWTGFDGAPKTFVLSGYSTFKKKPYMAVGGLITNDRSGLLQRTSLHGSYSYHLKINKNVNLGFGLALGYVQYNVKIYDAKPYDLDDEFMKNNILNANAFDANAGLYLYSKKFFFGFSSQQIANGKIYWNNTIGRLTPHAYAYTGYNFVIDKKKKEWIIQPSALVRFNNPAPYQLEFNLKTIYKDQYWIGGSFRLNSTASFLVGVNINHQFGLAYSYDYTLSNLQKYSTGSHEFMLSYKIAAKKRKTASDKVLDADEEELNTIDNSIKSNLKNKKKDEKK